MTWGEIKANLDAAMSHYTTQRCRLFRKGKYTTGNHYKDGFIAMVHETIKELSTVDDMYPMDVPKTRKLIGAFNRLTSEHVEDVWQ